MAPVILRQVAQQLVTKLPPGAHVGASVRFIDDHELRAGAHEVVAPALALDVVERDHRERMHREDGFIHGEATLESRRAVRRHGGRLEVEALVKFAHPLVHEMRRAKHREARDLSAVVQLARNQRRLDGFADTHVIGHEQAHRFLAQRHEQRHELIRAGLERQVAEAAERPGASTQ